MVLGAVESFLLQKLHLSIAIYNNRNVSLWTSFRYYIIPAFVLWYLEIRAVTRSIVCLEL